MCWIFTVTHNVHALMLPDSASFIMIEVHMLIYKARHSPRVKHLTWRWPWLVCHLRTRVCLTGIETPLKSGKSDTIFCFNQQQARSLFWPEVSHCIVDKYIGAFVTMRRRFCTLMKISLRCDYAHEDLAAMWLRFRCVSSPRRCRYENFEQGQNLRNEVAIMKFPIRFYCALGVSATLLTFLPRFVSFWPKFRIVAETPSSGIGV